MKKIFANLILGIALMSQVDIGSNIYMKTVCVNGYEFVITYVGQKGTGSVGSFDGSISVNQIYQKIDDNAGNPSSVPKKCKE